MHLLGYLIFGPILNFIGGSLRWIYGSVWRTIFNQPKYTFKEYLYGPIDSEDWFDQQGHGCVNIIIAFAFFFVLAVIAFRFL
jgi:hypothetical protein